MLGHIYSGAIMGVKGFIVNVEAQLSSGMSQFFLTGLPEGAVKEARTRVKSALTESGFRWPIAQITLNLAPADIRKDGSAYDLPIALAILSVCGEINTQKNSILSQCLVLGELALNGTLRPIKGALPICLAAREANLSHVILPPENAEEANLVEGLHVHTTPHLSDIISALRTEQLPPIYQPQKIQTSPNSYTNELDLADVNAQYLAKRALEIAAAGRHNLLFIGPPGSGKTMLSKRLPTIMSDMTYDESLEVTSIYSIAGNLPSGKLIKKRPFRCPHHTISDVGLVGGGSPLPRAGEISLAHLGVLFLDELPEFRRNVLEVLRQPLEDGQVSITRRLQTATFPTRFILVASMNACPCGYLGSKIHPCRCSRQEIHRYQSRISGPLLDRIDIQVELNDLKYDEMFSSNTQRESSASIRQRVENVQHIQQQRFANEKCRANGEMNAQLIAKYCQLDEKGHTLLRRVVDNLGVSARAMHRILKVSRTIADLNKSENIKCQHIAEALSLRKRIATQCTQPIQITTF